jgi:hypothetical protein
MVDKNEIQIYEIGYKIVPFPNTTPTLITNHFYSVRRVLTYQVQATA